MMVEAKKLENVVCNMLSSEPGISRTQLVKLSYLADREYFKDHKKTLTETDYILYFYGPYSHDFKFALKNLKEKNIIEEKYDGISYHISLTDFGAKRVPNLKKEENDSLIKVIDFAKEKGFFNSASAIKKYVYSLDEVKKAKPFKKIDLCEI